MSGQPILIVEDNALNRKLVRDVLQAKYKYRPGALVYDKPSGKVMDVEGCRAVVQRIR